MKIQISIFSVLFLFMVAPLQADFHFSHKYSKVRLGATTRFIVSNNINNVDGTIDLVDPQVNTISGPGMITFNNGIFGSSALSTLVAGVYQVNAGDSILLQGSIDNPHQLNAESGAAVPAVVVKGGYNTIQGRPLFTAPILFDGDPLTTLTVNLQGKLNKNIVLGGGTLVLNDDLLLADDVMLSDSGVIKLNYKSLHLPGAESSWTSTLYFDSATDLQLHAHTLLSGAWTFSGQNTLNGNGVVLDMSYGGSIVVERGSRLYCNNLVLKGIGDSAGLGRFIFMDELAQMVFANVTVELESSCTTLLGGIYVDGPATVVVKNFEWWFDQKGSLTVDGVTVWEDQAGIAVSSGNGIKFASSAANYSSIASGTIKMMGSPSDFSSLQSLVLATSNAQVASSSLSIANSNAIINMGGQITNNSNAIIGLGNQVVNNSNAIVGLENQIVNNSNAIINMGGQITNNSNAIVGLGNQVVNNSNAIVWQGSQIVNNSNAIINMGNQITNNSNAIVALGSQVVANSGAIIYLLDLIHSTTSGRCAHLFAGETLTFTQDQVYDGEGNAIVFSPWDQPQFIVKPGVKVTLKNIELRRLNGHTFQLGEGAVIKIANNVLFELSEDVSFPKGKIELLGEKNVFVVRGADGIRRFSLGGGCLRQKLLLDLGTSTMLLQNIELVGLEFIDGTFLLRDRYYKVVGAIALGGNAIVNVLYNSKMHFVIEGMGNQLRFLNNDIHLSGSLLFGNLLDNHVHMKFLLKSEMVAYPRVYFDHDFILLTAPYGWSRLLFDDSYVQVVNEMEQSFVVSQRSFLGGQHLEIFQKPIKQVSRDFAMAPGLVLMGDMPNVIEQDLLNSQFRYGRAQYEVITALHEITDRDLIINKHESIQDFQVQNDPLDMTNFLSRPRTRGFGDLISTDVDLEVNYNSIQLAQAKNTIRVDGGMITSFGVHATEPLALTLANASMVQQGGSDTAFKSGDTLAVQGSGNKIVVTKKLTVNNPITFSDQSELIFEFSREASNPEVVFAPTATNLIDIARGARLVFKGKGTVTFANGYTIALGGQVSGTKAELVVQDSAILQAAAQAIIKLTGVGKITIDNNAIFKVNDNRHFILGQNENDSFEILIDRNANLVIDALREQPTISGDDLTRKAQLSLQGATYSFDCNRGGVLHIGRGGLLEINALGNQEKQGFLTHLTCKNDGAIRLDEGGLFMLGRNKNTPYRRTEMGILWDNTEGVLSVGGLMGLVGSDLLGTMQNNLFGPIELLAQDLVLRYINTMPSLAVTTVFVDGKGTSKVRTKNGVVVTLLAGDEVTGDDPLTGTISITNNGDFFAISAEGERS